MTSPYAPPPPPSPSRRWIWVVSGLVALVVVAVAVTLVLVFVVDLGEEETDAIPEDATVAWTAPIEEEWDADDAVHIGDVVVVSTKWTIEESSNIVAFDAEDGSAAWEYGWMYGSIELTPVGTDEVQACDDLGGVILDPEGEVVREATAEECPEEFDGADTEKGDVYEVDGDELLVYSSPEFEELLYRVQLEDEDPLAWGVEGGVVTFYDGQVRFYR